MGGEEDGGEVTTTLFYIGRLRHVKSNVTMWNSAGAIATQSLLNIFDERVGEFCKCSIAPIFRAHEKIQLSRIPFFYQNLWQ